MQTISLPPKAAQIIRSLNSAGFEAYAVGGCVRDSLIGRVPGDWDITTSALPAEIKALFRRTVDTGIVHGTVTVMLGDEGFEVTTYRLDGAYSDGRHPDRVSFSTSLEEDLKRRDFTVNAMAYHPEKGLVDLFGGLEDLENRTIRAVGDPMARFEEDALRIMRAVRFSAQLDFQIEEETAEAIRHFAPRLSLISRERIRDELVKLLVSGHPEQVRRLWECGITAEILPIFDVMMETPQNTVYHCCSVGEHTLKVLTHIEADPVLRLAALLHDTGKPECRTTDAAGQDHFKGHAIPGARIAEDFLREYRFDNRTVNLVTRLVRVHDDRFVPGPETVRRQLNRVGEDLLPYYLKMIVADNRSKSDYAWTGFSKRYPVILSCLEDIRREGQCVFLKDLAVGGSDLIAAGMKPGPALGSTLNAMLEDVLKTPEHNRRDYLLEHFLPGAGAE